MFVHKRLLVLYMGLFGIALFGGSRAEAGGIAITTPAGLKPGDKFRVVFVTDGMTAATLTDISAYNSFVTMQAGGATYDGVTVTWSAIASTTSVSASSNIGSIDTPIYLSNGTLVSAASDLWSGSLYNPINTDLAGNTFGANTTVFTGTTASGASDSNYPVGTEPNPGNSVESGDITSTTSTWVSDGPLGANADHFYAISGILTVQAIPEPSSLILGMTAIGAGLAVASLRGRTAWTRSGPGHSRPVIARDHGGT
jgi:hypothetical protein